MDAAQINALIYQGRAIAASIIGTPYVVSRPIDPADPLGNPVATLYAAFNAADNKYGKPGLYGKPIWFADMDGSQVDVGDYLAEAACAPPVERQIYFVAGLQSLLPIVVVKCNSALRLLRTNDPGGTQIGAGPYSGKTDAWDGATDVLGCKAPFVGWPCSMVLGKGAERFTGAVPSSPRTMPGWEIMLPPSVPAQIVLGDRFADMTGRFYSVQQAELSELGWRVIAAEVHA
jgi:hypothetical protein